MRRHDPCISDLALDEWLAGDCDSPSRAEVERHLAHCVRCRLQRDVFVRERDSFLARAPDWHSFVARRDTGRPLRPAGSARTRDHTAWIAAIALAASVVIGLFTLEDRQPSHRSKGGPKIGVFLKRDARVSRAISGERVQPGDQLRIVYSSPAPTYFALLHRDAKEVTIHHPLAAHSVRVAAGNEVALDFGIRLDGAPGREELHGLFCTKPLLLEPLRAELARGGSLLHLEGCIVDVVELDKAEAGE